MNSGAAVGGSALSIDAKDMCPKDLVGLRPLTGRALREGIIASARDAIEPAKRAHGVFPPLGGDEFEDFFLRSETKRMAFFKRSCSILRSW
jgi:hypothetical protein